LSWWCCSYPWLLWISCTTPCSGMPFSIYDLGILCRFQGQRTRKMKLIHALRGCSGITSALVSGLNTVPFIIEQSVMVDHVFINIVDSILWMNCSPASSWEVVIRILEADRMTLVVVL
jgi:hypothetical protein